VKRQSVALAIALAALVGSGCKDPNTSFRIDHCGVPLAAAPTDTANAAVSLRLVTLNMWGIPYVSQYIDERFTALAERLRGDRSVDVVGLQEMWDGEARARLLEAIRAEFPYQVDFHGEHGRSGLALVSRRPFVGEPRFRGFARLGKWWKPWNGEWFGGKGVGAVRIAVDADNEVLVAVTHLHSCYDAGAPLACDETDEFADFRRTQLAEVRDFVNELAGDEPAVILGDFNFTPTSTHFAGVRTEREGRGFDPGWLPIPEAQAPATRIDHVWLRPGRAGQWRALAPARVTYADPVVVAGGAEPVPLSDHCAIVATIGR